MASKEDSTGGATPSKGEAVRATTGVGGARISDDPVPDLWFGEHTEERRGATCSAAVKRNDGLATALFCSLRLGQPILLEGEAGVGKTEVAKTLARMLDRRLIRLQCYEGLDVNTTIYEWNYTRQMLQIRLLESSGASGNTSLDEITCSMPGIGWP